MVIKHLLTGMILQERDQKPPVCQSDFFFAAVMEKPLSSGVILVRKGHDASVLWLPVFWKCNICGLCSSAPGLANSIS